MKLKMFLSVVSILKERIAHLRHHLTNEIVSQPCQEIIAIGFDMLNTIYNFNYLFAEGGFQLMLEPIFWLGTEHMIHNLCNTNHGPWMDHESHLYETPSKSSFDTYLFGVGSYLFLMAEKYLLVTNEIENSSFGENLINLYNNFTDVQGKRASV